MDAENPYASAPLRWLYVDFNSYFASVEQQLNPRLRNRPIAVVPVMSDATCAIAASYEAKAFGIKTGTPVWEAKRLCPELICVEADHQHYVRVHGEILEEINQHIPVSAICSIDEMACRLMDNENEEGYARDIARRIKAGLAKNIGSEVRCSIGIAPNRYVAKLATDMKKPNGLTVIHAMELPERLRVLALRDLTGVGRNIEQRLWRNGIYTMSELLRRPPKHLRAIWGNVGGEKMWHLLRGADLPEVETSKSCVGHSHVLAPELRGKREARYVAMRLVIKAASRLRRLGYYMRAMTLQVKLENGPCLVAEARCYRAQDTPTLLRMLEELWQAALGCQQQVLLKKISVSLHGLVPVGALQEDLFDGISERALGQQKKYERLSTAMDKMNYKHGRDTVLVGILPAQGKSFAGTKVAFTRIPELEEFYE